MPGSNLTIFGALTAALTVRKDLSPVYSNPRSWWPLVHESFAGAWQRNVTVNADTALSFHAVYACTTLIAADISKLRLKLVSLAPDGTWNETTNPAYSPVLRKPNHYQTRQQFFESWVLSKLMRGNTYALKQRDNRGVVTALFVLDPSRVRPLVSESGEVFYELRKDPLSRQTQDTFIVPAREVVHDRMNCLFHPLVGIPPIYACGLAATGGLAIQNNSTAFFQNGSRPGGILTAPGDITQETADRLKADWQTHFGGGNMGRLAVLGDGLKYEALSMTAEESQLIEQLKWSAETVCSVFHIPAFMAGVGPPPAYDNVENLTALYYAQALQVLIEAIEACVDDGLGMSETIGVEFDLDGLLRTDSATRIKSLSEAVKGSIMAPNEARRKLDLPPVEGGENPLAQQQNFSLAALAERDRDKPFSKAAKVKRQGKERTVVTKHDAAGRIAEFERYYVED